MFHSIKLSKGLPKDHMARVQKVICSTNSNCLAILKAYQKVDTVAPAEHICSATGNKIICFAILRNIVETIIHSNITSRSQIKAYTGMDYMFVYYVYKLNTILLYRTKDRKDEELVTMSKGCYDKLNDARGHPSALSVVDNKNSHVKKRTCPNTPTSNSSSYTTLDWTQPSTAARPQSTIP
jgi:hypothetical protein